MARCFSVQVETVMVVQARGVKHAAQVALDNIEAAAGNGEFRTYEIVELDGLDELPGGWNAMCIPWGGTKPIARLLSAESPARGPRKGADDV